MANHLFGGRCIALLVGAGAIVLVGLTHADAGKLKRLRRTARVTLAPCAYTGAVTGPVSEGNARILTGSEERMAAAAALANKYGVMLTLYHAVRTARRMLQRQAKVEDVYLAIEPIAG